MKVLVLGCGPAGLIAARTAQLCGAHVTIFSRREKRAIYGAQFIHDYVDGVTTAADHGYIHVRSIGDEAGYATKLHGNPEISSGWEWADNPFRQGWDIRAVYERLWEELHKGVFPTEIDAQRMQRYHDDDWDYIFNTVPLRALCSVHRFDMYQVKIDQPYRLDPYLKTQNTIIYNGDPNEAWYRASLLFGVDGGNEYPFSANMPEATVVNKPKSTNCDCWPRIVRIGRYGKWSFDGFVHEGGHKVKEILDG